MKRLLFIVLLFSSFSVKSQPICQWQTVGDSLGGPQFLINTDSPSRNILQFIKVTCCPTCPAAVYLNGEFSLTGNLAFTSPIHVFDFPAGFTPSEEFNGVTVYTSAAALSWTAYLRVKDNGEAWLWKQGTAQFFAGDRIQISIVFLTD